MNKFQQLSRKLIGHIVGQILVSITSMILYVALTMSTSLELFKSNKELTASVQNL